MKVRLTWQPDDGPEETVTVHDADDETVATVEEAVGIGPGSDDVLVLASVSVTPDGPLTDASREDR